MIYKLIQRIVISFVAIGIFYGCLQIDFVQRTILTTAIKLFTTYEIKSIQLKSTKKFPFEINITELIVVHKAEDIATFKDLSWKISNLSKINLTISEASVRVVKSSEKFNFSHVSTSEIADIIQNSIHYLSWFENISLEKLLVNQKVLNLHLKRVDQEAIISLLNDNQQLDLRLNSVGDKVTLTLNGMVLNSKITLNADIQENVINFLGSADIAPLFDEKISNFFGSEIVASGKLVKNKEWQFQPLKISTSNGYEVDGNCYIKDQENISIKAKVRADDKNAATFDISVSLLPFEISGYAEIIIEDLQKFSKPFWSDVKGKLNLNAQFTKFTGFENGSVKIEGKGLIEGKDFYLPINADIDLNNGVGRGNFNTKSKKTHGHYLNHSLEIDIDFDSSISEIKIEKFKVLLNDLQMVLLKPVNYSWKNGLSSAQMQFCKGLIEVKDLKFSNSNIDSGIFNLRNIQIGGLNILFGQEDITGILNGQVKILPDHPVIIQMHLEQGTWSKNQHAEVYKILKNVSANFDGNIKDSIANWKLTISDQDKINLESSGNMHVLSHICDASLKGLIKLNLLTDWLGTGDKIFGDVSFNLHCKGPVENLHCNGEVNADNGLYEHNEVGTFYKDITIRSQVNGRKLTITRFDGKDITGSNDPSHGQLRGEGWIDFNNILSPVFHVPLYLNHLRISQNDSFISDASGQLLIKGTGASVNCEGEVTLEQAEYFIIENSEKMIPGIIDQKADKAKLKAKNTGTAFPLDILVHAPVGSFKVTGAGANSLWFGDIYVRKSIINPFLVGTVSLHEGTLDVLGKVLKITEGVITFVDDDRNNPRMDIKAEKDLGDGLVVALEIKGTGKDTILEFTSTPPMAREEVMSLLLFGKKLGEVSVLQSIQLAELTKPSHGSKKAGFFERLRSGLGFDQLEFKTTTRGGAAENDTDATPAERAAGTTSQAVRIGKEFGKVQVGIEQGAGSETSKVIVSTPLGKHLMLQGDVGGAQNAGVGIGWVKRY